MIFHFHVPVPPLNRYVANMVYFEGFNPEHNVDRLLPDGHMELLIDLTDTPKYIYDNETLKEIQACHHVWISGLRTQYISIPSGKDSRLLVVTFQRGQAFPFLPLPVQELTNCVVDADLIFGDLTHQLREQLLGLNDAFQMFACIERFLMNQMCPPDDPTQACVSFAVEQLSQNPSQMRLEKNKKKIGYSQKHFIHLFKKQVGVTPKQFLKIMRFQQVIRTLSQQKHLAWHQLALDCGYFDQAHFIHDFKQFAGMTPSLYSEREIFFENYIPIG